MWTFEEASHFVRELDKSITPFGYQPALVGECLFQGATTGALEVALVFRPGTAKKAVTQVQGLTDFLKARFDLTQSADPLERLGAFHTAIGDRKLRLLVPSAMTSLLTKKTVAAKPAPTGGAGDSLSLKSLLVNKPPKATAHWDKVSGLAGSDCTGTSGFALPPEVKSVPGCGAIYTAGDDFYWLSYGPKNYWSICEACANKAGIFKPGEDVDLTTAKAFDGGEDDYGTWALTKAAIAKGLKFQVTTHPKVMLNKNGQFWSIVIGLVNSNCGTCEGHTYIKHEPVFNQGSEVLTQGSSNYICATCAAAHGHFPPFVKVS